MHFEEWMELVVKAFEVAGVAILAVGSIAALVGAAMSVSRGERTSAYKRARHDVGRAILLGLEVLIIADIVQTITIDPTLESALTLRADRGRANVPQLLAGDRARRDCPLAQGQQGGRPNGLTGSSPCV